MTKQTVMDRWVAGFANRDEMAAAYAELLRTEKPSWPTWIVVNVAIMDRWSMSGLRYVKEKAWAQK